MWGPDSKLVVSVGISADGKGVRLVPSVEIESMSPDEARQLAKLLILTAQAVDDLRTAESPPAGST